jgi:hypothetical protein
MHKLKREVIHFKPWGEKNLPKEDFEETAKDGQTDRQTDRQAPLVVTTPMTFGNSNFLCS